MSSVSGTGQRRLGTSQDKDIARGLLANRRSRKQASGRFAGAGGELTDMTEYEGQSRGRSKEVSEHSYSDGGTSPENEKVPRRPNLSDNISDASGG